MTTIIEPIDQHSARSIWETPANLAGRLSTIDHKLIGMRYIATSFTFFVLGGLQALLMRAQLTVPENTLVTPQLYNQLFTMHGTTMIFYFATPILFGFGNYLVPLMIGSRDMAFPRLNAFGYWVFLLSGLFIYSSYLFGMAPNGGWFNYMPLNSYTYSPGLNVDFYALGLLFLGISTTAGAINFIVTIFKLRAPGMSLNRMPLFCWTILAASFAVIFAYPTLNVANFFLELDRKFGTQFYNATAGGHELLWQHLFWIFGHPDVYIIFLPAAGMVSEIIATFSRRPIVGYAYLAISALATAVISFGVWAHHMFAVGIPLLANSFFSAATLSITIPAGLQFFAWIATIWAGRPKWRVAFLFALGFLFNFLIGGLSGVMFAAVPFDQQVTDTYFVVAHFHYVLLGGMVFPLFGAFYYWLPKMTGRLLNETLGQWNFWLMFLGFNLTFFPMHILGLLGMPRRYYTYLPGLGFETGNLLATIGGAILALGILLFMINWLVSLRSGELADENPWAAGSLEWATPSPPPPYNFRMIPTVTSSEPLWEQDTNQNLWQVIDARAEGETVSYEPHPQSSAAAQPPRVLEEAAPEVAYADLYTRDTIATTLLDARPEGVMHIPDESYWPLITAIGLAILFVGLLLNLYWADGVGLLMTLVGMWGWMWPQPRQHERESEDAS